MGIVPAWCVYAKSGYVANERDAILAARAIWYCAHSDPKPLSEEGWIKSSQAVLHAGVWQVGDKWDPRYAGGGIIIYVNQSDGSLREMEMTQ